MAHYSRTLAPFRSLTPIFYFGVHILSRKIQYLFVFIVETSHVLEDFTGKLRVCQIVLSKSLVTTDAKFVLKLFIGKDCLLSP